MKYDYARKLLIPAVFAFLIGCDRGKATLSVKSISHGIGARIAIPYQSNNEYIYLLRALNSPARLLGKTPAPPDRGLKWNVCGKPVSGSQYCVYAESLFLDRQPYHDNIQLLKTTRDGNVEVYASGRFLLVPGEVFSCTWLNDDNCILWSTASKDGPGGIHRAFHGFTESKRLDEKLHIELKEINHLLGGSLIHVAALQPGKSVAIVRERPVSIAGAEEQRGDTVSAVEISPQESRNQIEVRPLGRIAGNYASCFSSYYAQK